MKMRKMSHMIVGSLIAVTNLSPIAATAAENSETSDKMEGYLFAYFTGNARSQEQICFALSTDGFNYTPLNNGYPVVSSDSIAIKKAVRDPHILRGEGDGYFYMVVTDMASSEGWASNRGMVLMRSKDLVSWEHHTIHFPTRYAGTMFANVTRVWAPQTIYDKKAKKYMVYFSILTNDGKCPYDKVYWAYANEDFSDFESEPQELFDRGYSSIDTDIVEKDGQYHVFFKTEDGSPKKGIKQYVTTDLHDPAQWSLLDGYCEQTNVGVEGGGVFQLIDSDEWVLMYDCYGNGYYQFCKSTDLLKFTWVCNTATSGNFTPRHGTTIQITRKEAETLGKAFPSYGMSASFDGWKNNSILSDAAVQDGARNELILPIAEGTDNTSFAPGFTSITSQVYFTPEGEQDFSNGPITYEAHLDVFGAASTPLNVRVDSPEAFILQQGTFIEYDDNSYTLIDNNLITNGDFEADITEDNEISGWYGGNNKALLGTRFKLNSTGGAFDNGNYISAITGGGSKISNSSIGMTWPLEVGETYYFSCYAKNGGSKDIAVLYQTEKEKTDAFISDENDNPVLSVNVEGEYWQRNEIIFTATHPNLQLSLRNLTKGACFDRFTLTRVREGRVNAIEQVTEDNATAGQKTEIYSITGILVGECEKNTDYSKLPLSNGIYIIDKKKVIINNR